MENVQIEPNSMAFLSFPEVQFFQSCQKFYVGKIKVDLQFQFYAGFFNLIFFLSLKALSIKDT